MKFSHPKIQQWSESAFRLVDGSTLGVFRIAWGLIMILETRWLWLHTRDLHSPEYVHFHFQGLSWIRHFPEGWMIQLEVALMMATAVLITVGIFFRPATILFFVAYAHLFFAEAAAYNNHFYLILLVSGLLVFTRAGACLSLRQWRRSENGQPDKPVPYWNYLVFRFQVVVVYVFGAIAKLNRDWLVEMEPIRFWLQNGEHIPEPIAAIASRDWFTYVGAWGGFLIDLVFPLLLLAKRTRWLAIIVLVAFHLLNSQLFRIGYFPLIGISLILVFLPPNLFRRRRQEHPVERGQARVSGTVLTALGLYCLFQLLFPLRWHLFRPHHPSWTDVGHRFAWRMMLRERITTLDVHFGDPRVDRWLDQRPRMLPRIAPSARIRAMEYPTFVWQYVQEIRDRLSDYGLGDSEIYVHATSSLNGRPFYPSIDPNVDLGRAEMPPVGVPDWIVPLPSGLPVDYDQISLEGDGRAEAYEALSRYFVENPGPGAAFLKPPETE